MLASFNLPIDDYFDEHAQTTTQEQPCRLPVRSVGARNYLRNAIYPVLIMA